MKSKLVYASLMFLSFMFSCDDRYINPYVCKAPSLISADQSCNSNKGLVLTATSENAALELEWTVIALKDSAASGWTNNDLQIVATTASTNYTVPDSVIKTYKILIVSVATKCLDDKLLHSVYHRFIQTKSATSSCTVWTLKNSD